jgi:hypothetical protein
LIQQPFYTGVGSDDVPTDQQWIDALNTYLPQLYSQGYTFYIDPNDNTVTITSNTSTPNYVDETFTLNAGTNIQINCNNG